MKSYVHARLGDHERTMLERLKKATGESESAIIRRGLRLVSKELGDAKSALALAGRSVGKFRKAPRDLSTNPRHLDEFGK